MKATYIHGPGIDEPLMMNREGNNYFYHTDGLGSVVGLSNDLGEIEQQYLYTSFGGMTVFDKEGSEIQLIDGIKNPYGYTGREMDTESDIYFYRARYYDPDTGRFMSQDPIGFTGEDTNLYRYCKYNPVNCIDPDGKFGIVIGGSLSTFLGIGGGEVGAGVGINISLKNGIEVGTIGHASIQRGVGLDASANINSSLVFNTNSFSDLTGSFVGVTGGIGPVGGGVAFSKGQQGQNVTSLTFTFSPDPLLGAYGAIETGQITGKKLFGVGGSCK